MKKINKFFSLLFACGFVFSVVGCTDTPGSSSSGNGSDPTYTTVYEDVTHAPASPVVTAENMQKYTTYYFDSISGNDTNTGLSETSPMKSMEKASEIIDSVEATTPVRILFKAGSAYSGSTFVIGGFEATEETPLIVSTYGYAEGSENRFVKFTNARTSTATVDCVKIQNGNIQISNIECDAPLATYGINVSPVDAGAMKNIVIKDCYVHDVGFLTKKEDINKNQALLGLAARATEDIQIVEGVEPSDEEKLLIHPTKQYDARGAGIYMATATSSDVGPSWFENVWLENNKIERVSRSGIWISSSWVYRPGIQWGNNRYYDDDTNWYPHKNVYAVGNALNTIGGDGLVFIAVDGGYMENNTCYYAQYLGREPYYNVGIWPHSCKNLIIQFNEAAYTFGTNDGQGFDIDIGCSDIVFQYNYSHHNEGGGLLFCNSATNVQKYDENGDYVLDERGKTIVEYRASYWGRVTIRNNVFADNDGPVIAAHGYISDWSFENNTVILPAERESTRTYEITDTEDMNDTKIVGDNWRLVNNVFYNRGDYSTTFEVNMTKHVSFDSNAFWGFDDNFHDELENPITTRITSSGTVKLDPGYADVVAKMGYENISAFIPTNNALFTGALELAKMSAYDMAQKTAKKGVYYYGAFSSK